MKGLLLVRHSRAADSAKRVRSRRQSSSPDSVSHCAGIGSSVKESNMTSGSLAGVVCTLDSVSSQWSFRPSTLIVSLVTTAFCSTVVHLSVGVRAA
jgi:hypothetical protein